MRWVIITILLLYTPLAQAYGESYWGTETPEKRMYKIGQHLLSSGEIEQNISFRVIRSENDVNASANELYRTVYVTEDLLKYVDSDDEIAGVMAHEIAHIELQHTTERLNNLILYSNNLQNQLNQSRRRRVGATSVFMGILGGLSGQGFIPTALDSAAQTDASISAQNSQIYALTMEEYRRTIFNAYAQEQEYEADKYAVLMLMASGYNPFAFETILHKVASESNNSLSSHPVTSERIARVDELLQKVAELIKQTQETETLQATQAKP